jgi:hypothetical protein
MIMQQACGTSCAYRKRARGRAASWLRCRAGKTAALSMTPTEAYAISSACWRSKPAALTENVPGGVPPADCAAELSLPKRLALHKQRVLEIASVRNQRHSPESCQGQGRQLVALQRVCIHVRHLHTAQQTASARKQCNHDGAARLLLNIAQQRISIPSAKPATAHKNLKGCTACHWKRQYRI